MESKVAQQVRLDTIDALKKLSPEERLNAFRTHCELIMELNRAGKQLLSQKIHPTDDEN
jgi:hypothetical protein